MTISVQFYTQGGPSSGVLIENLGDDTFDHIGFYGPSDIGPDATVNVGSAQDVTWVVDDAGLARKGGSAESGQMNNLKWIDASGYSLNSGVRQALPNVQSGYCTLRIEVTDTGSFNIQNAKLFAYNGTDVNVNPTQMWVMAAEVVPPAFAGTGDSEWALIDATNYNYFVDRTVGVGYSAALSFNYFVALSIRPTITATSGAKSLGFGFSFETV